MVKTNGYAQGYLGYKAVLRPTLDVVTSSIPFKLFKTQHLELKQDARRTPTRQNTSNASQIRQKHNIHHTHYTTNKTQTHTPVTIFKKQPTFNNTRYTTISSRNPDTITEQDINSNLTTIHTTIVTKHLATWPNNKILHHHL